jgi:biotin carboxylase
MRTLVLSTSRAAHRALKKMGHDIVAFVAYKDGVAKDLHAGYDGLFYFTEKATDQEYVELACVLHKYQPFDCVYSFQDNMQLIATKIATELDLKTFYSPELLMLVNDKDKMRTHLQEAGLDDTAFELIHNQAQLEVFAQTHGFPLILKPTCATASLGVSKIACAADIPVAVAHLTTGNSQFPGIVETFISGREFSVEAFSENREHHVIAITEKFKDPISFVELGHVIPANITVDEQQQINEYVGKVLEAIDIISGPTHTEIILTSKGPRIIETHTRPGGDKIDSLIDIVCGVDLFTMTAKQAIGESVLKNIIDTLKTDQVAAVWFANPQTINPVKITAISGVDEAEKIDGVVDVRVMKKLGDTLHKTTDSYSRSAFAIAKGPTHDDAINSAKAALAAINLTFNCSTE